jgi:hypothetical protein
MATDRELLLQIAEHTATLPELGRRIDLVEVRVEQLEEDVGELAEVPTRLTRLEVEHAERSERGGVCGPQVQVARIGYRQAVILALVALASSIVTAVITAVAT